ncbi:MAG: ABC transporter permease [Phycisphaerae bacterium]|nr:ABC transporter permease [Phycisphaerae bacterium]
MTSKDEQQKTISGIDVMRGVGIDRAKDFWADAWDRVYRRPGAFCALVWIGIIGFFAIFSPLIANGLPIWLVQQNADGTTTASSPLWQNLTATDLMLLLGGFIGIPWILIPMKIGRGHRLGMLITLGILSGLIIVLASAVSGYFGDSGASRWAREIEQTAWFVPVSTSVICIICGAGFLFIPFVDRILPRTVLVVVTCLLTGLAVGSRWNEPLINYEKYQEMAADGDARAWYTLVPWSPNESRTDLYVVPPGLTVKEKLDEMSEKPFGDRQFIMGTDGIGRDVLSQMMHACRLSISIGLISTGIAVLIGVTLGALMGYFGGIVDLLLYRLVEIFMAIPVLFLLIVAAAVLPRNTYVMMIIIGCVAWTGAARFTRAEFLKLRSQDFVQSARAVGLPLRSILFKHMLPNGVTPVLVDSSFAIASAILFEATLSFLGLGPEGQASWGKLLSSATGVTGTFVWWLAIFPGLAIFLTVLAYNLLGEAFRDAIDPKLRKAAH